jgi:hypothetical protein
LLSSGGDHRQKGERIMNSKTMDELTRLIIYLGLAIPIKRDDLHLDSSWAIKPYQNGEPPLFLEQMRHAIEIADEQRDALLLFSGGQTDQLAEPLSEAQGLFMAADAQHWFDRANVKQRASTEEYALDTLQNITHCLCRFKQCVNTYPRSITVVGYEFKRQRINMHREAIRFPLDHFTFRGPNNPPDLAKALEGETKTIELFKASPYGATARLADKRAERNPFRRQHGYAISCPELRDLLEYTGTTPFVGPLPWDKD